MNDHPSNAHFEVVMIDDREYRVPQAVCDEIETLREKRCQLAWTEVGPDDTIIITVPSAVSMEFQAAVGERAKEQFPEHRVAVLPEALGFHTEEGFGEALQMAMKVATAVLEEREGDAKTAAQEFIERCTDKPEPSE